jgi:hypothetical protein
LIGQNPPPKFGLRARCEGSRLSPSLLEGPPTLGSRDTTIGMPSGNPAESSTICLSGIADSAHRLNRHRRNHKARPRRWDRRTSSRPGAKQV